ncbi:hypothetical protein N658DRAFT_203883 [Parathielavia hyrcaniae]|uniref:Uncharacterized protein n=1 Tax=Parathielavia hyrcaniae TaxID=113614 RepID=A0AAN6PZP0_9PEZI|nr:hypothetical protein N658DRAFT_203883 [Parathielavia hyrcaniae]
MDRFRSGLALLLLPEIKLLESNPLSAGAPSTRLVQGRPLSNGPSSPTATHPAHSTPPHRTAPARHGNVQPAGSGLGRTTRQPQRAPRDLGRVFYAVPGIYLCAVPTFSRGAHVQRGPANASQFCAFEFCAFLSCRSFVRSSIQHSSSSIAIPRLTSCFGAGRNTNTPSK